MSTDVHPPTEPPASGGDPDGNYDGNNDPGDDRNLVAQSSADFAALRKAFRAFVFPATVAFLVWYLLYVVLSAYARGFMDTKVVGNINIALVFGVLQFVSTFAIAIAYSRYAKNKLDPLAEKIKAELLAPGGSHHDGVAP